MNRNVESHFSMLPSAHIERSRFDRSQDIKFTFNVGELIPFYVDEVLPGDTFDITTSKVVRLQTLLTPVMDNLYLDTYFFFVPNRLVWDHWQNFMGESDKAWLPSVEYRVPDLILKDNTVAGDGAVQVGDILDYMGVPTGVSRAISETSGFAVNALPYRAYLKIYDDWFRDENLVDPVNIYTGDASYNYGNPVVTIKKPFKVAKFHDYFTSCLPNRAKVTNLGGNFSSGSVAAPVYGSPTNTLIPVGGFPASHNVGGTVFTSNVDDYVTQLYMRRDPTTGALGSGPSFNGTTQQFRNLYAQSSPDLFIGAVDIVSLRYAFQVQKFYEALARSGSRYIEILSGLFGVNSPDQRLQRSEYLGGNRIPISIHQITNQSQGENDFLGDLGAMSLTTDKHSDFTKSFVEHGFVIGCVCARYDHSYPQGLERFWFRDTRFEYYWPQFAHLSEQPVYLSELYIGNDSELGAVFGFQEAWSDYRYKPNRVASEMRPGVSNTLDS